MIGTADFGHEHSYSRKLCGPRIIDKEISRCIRDQCNFSLKNDMLFCPVRLSMQCNATSSLGHCSFRGYSYAILYQCLYYMSSRSFQGEYVRLHVRNRYATLIIPIQQSLRQVLASRFILPYYAQPLTKMNTVRFMQVDLFVHACKNTVEVHIEVLSPLSQPPKAMMHLRRIFVCWRDIMHGKGEFWLVDICRTDRFNFFCVF
jgi:hypothetical protein